MSGLFARRIKQHKDLLKNKGRKKLRLEQTQDKIVLKAQKCIRNLVKSDETFKNFISKLFDESENDAVIVLG